MASRSTRVACALICGPLLGASPARAAEPSSSPPPQASVPPVSSSLAAYRSYANEQAEMLVRMTKVLASDIKQGDVAAAQNEYAMAHRYLERIKPVASTMSRDLDARMDASVANDRAGKLDPSASGFHRLEHDLFAARSTDGLSVYADRLHADALSLQKVIAVQPIPSDGLIAGAAAMMETLSTQTLADGSEPYARTDLWDVEANLDGAREVVAAIRPRIAMRDPLAMARLSDAFATASERLARFEEGCGYKSFDALTSADKASLRAATATLARELSRLRSVPTID